MTTSFPNGLLTINPKMVDNCSLNTQRSPSSLPSQAKRPIDRTIIIKKMSEDEVKKRIALGKLIRLASIKNIQVKTTPELSNSLFRTFMQRRLWINLMDQVKRNR